MRSDAASETIAEEHSQFEIARRSSRHSVQPLPVLMQTLGSYAEDDEEFFAKFAPYFKQVVAHAGEVLWRQGEKPNGLYLIESGSLRATYTYDDHAELVQETMVAGTVAGDLSTLSDTPRNCTVVAERDCVLWKLDEAKLAQMEKEQPENTHKFIKIILKGASVRPPWCPARSGRRSRSRVQLLTVRRSGRGGRGAVVAPDCRPLVVSVVLRAPRP